MSLKGAHLIIQNSWIIIFLQINFEQKMFLLTYKLRNYAKNLSKYDLNLLYDPFNWQGQWWYQTGDLFFKIVIKVVPLF